MIADCCIMLMFLFSEGFGVPIDSPLELHPSPIQKNQFTRSSILGHGHDYRITPNCSGGCPSVSSCNCTQSTQSTQSESIRSVAQHLFAQRDSSRQHDPSPRVGRLRHVYVATMVGSDFNLGRRQRPGHHVQPQSCYFTH